MLEKQEKIDKRIVIFTGPQGSGNHVFAKVCALHKDVGGWDDLLKTYWIRHEHEQHVGIWQDASSIKKSDWSRYGYYALSISCPYIVNYETLVPRYQPVIDKFKSLGFDVVLAIIGRDENILKLQETRLRGRHSYHDLINLLPTLKDVKKVFVSQELLYLYRNYYLESLSEELSLPIDFNNSKLMHILRQDPNAKYVNEVGEQWTDNFTQKRDQMKSIAPASHAMTESTIPNLKRWKK
jgi:hypothetical protein